MCKGFSFPLNVHEGPLTVTKHVNSARRDRWSPYCDVCFSCISLAPRCSVFTRTTPGEAGGRGAQTAVDLSGPRCWESRVCCCRQGMVWGRWRPRIQSFPSRAEAVIPTSTAGAAASPSSFLSPLLDTILSSFHISRAKFRFAYTFETLWSSLVLHVDFWIRKVCKFDIVLISLIISVYRCTCSHAFLSSGWLGCPLCCVLLAADAQLAYGVLQLAFLQQL